MRGDFEEALNPGNPTVLDIQVDGTQLALPFRSNALKLPTSILSKYAETEPRNWAKGRWRLRRSSGQRFGKADLTL